MKISREVWQAINECPEAYQRGTDAHCEGKDPDINPYPRDSKEWLAWRAGWLGVC